MDHLVWLESEHKDRVEARKARWAAEATGTMAPKDDGTIQHLYDAIQEIKVARARLEVFTEVLRKRGVSIQEPRIGICPSTGLECERGLMDGR